MAAHLVRNSRLDPNYSSLNASDSVGAYAGYCIIDDQGNLFGMLCSVRSYPLSKQLELSCALDRQRRQTQRSDALAHTDALTGLLNRRGWEVIIADAEERSNGFGDAIAVAVIDLDGLKQVNDEQGHGTGDELLQRASRALESVAPQGGCIARYGGDEFMILANGVTPAQDEDYFSVFKKALDEAQVSASIGCAATTPGVVSVRDSVELAERMTYRNKRQR